MEIVLHSISILLILIGSFLCLSGGVGLLRFPDFYTRMHAASVTDTLATAMIVIGLILQTSELIIIFKLLLILVLTLFIGPTASHSLAKIALRNNVLPLTVDKEVTPSKR